MGLNQNGRYAILTNFRESALDDPDKSLGTIKSRGVIINEWLGATPTESLDEFVARITNNGVFKGIGGVSLICGDLQETTRGQSIKPASILSNRTDRVDQVPHICGTRGETVSLSNTIYSEESSWPKVKLGKDLMEKTISEAAEQDLDEDALTERLFAVLDHDTMPKDPNKTLAEYRDLLKTSIFIPAFTDAESEKCMNEARRRGREGNLPPFEQVPPYGQSGDGDEAEPKEAFLRGAYGTQRQTIVFVDFEGNVTYKERALWDAHGNQLKKGEADVVKKFRIGEPSN